jgi:superfamily II DNA or RNA helicase
MSSAAEIAARLPPLSFQGKLRPSQKEVMAIAEKKLKEGAKKLHIVAPPGSGKTVTGLYLWAMCIRKPALVLAPNSAIQVQWAARTDLFKLNDGRNVRELVSTEPGAPGLLTSLTYQSVTLPGRGNADLNEVALELWRQKLIDKGQAKDPDEAEVWLDDLRRHNQSYYEQRLGSYRKAVRDQAAMGGEALTTLHGSALATLERLKNAGIGLIILDECHHLLGHWGRVLADAHEMLGHPVIVGLTATPPDKEGKADADVKRYEEYFGPIDYEVPVPAVVKDGFLAPYQDLAYFVRPRADEVTFIANADKQLHELVEELCVEEAPPLEHAASVLPPNQGISNSPTEPPPPDVRESLPRWVARMLAERRSPTGVSKDWSAYQRREPIFVDAARNFLDWRDLPLPEDVPPLDSDWEAADIPPMDFLVPVIDRYVRHALRVSPREEDRKLAEQAIKRLRLLGVQVTEIGWQPCASPVGRVMAYSKAKAEALLPILAAEKAALGDKLRAVVVADYERTSAVSAEVSDLLDDEAGGAIAAFKTVVRGAETDSLNPILVTGSTVLIDDDIREPFTAAAAAWLADKKLDVQLEYKEEAGFHVLTGSGSDWSPRTYVELITELFQRGITQCLVGTRGLLGEGWDANKINVLIDLTTVTTSMTVNQLRGRSIRIDPSEPRKLANNWDVVCLAPEFTKGLDDYRRFRAKHETLYGVTDDGAIEKGVGHVHPAFNRIRPEVLEDRLNRLNDEMLERIRRRDEVRELWQIGKPYKAEPIRAVEARPLREREGRGFPPFKASRQPWTSKGLSLAIGQAVLKALIEAKLVRDPGQLQASDRAGGYVRVYLEGADPADAEVFTLALHEALGPLHRPRYVIPRSVEYVEDTWLSELVPEFLGKRWLQKRTPKEVMLHAVPTDLGRNKDLVAIYQRWWNELVSPGEAVYALREDGLDLIQFYRKHKMLPTTPVQEKEVFL